MNAVKKMKTSRKDVERNRKLIRVPKSSWLGFSSGTLRFGEFFITKDGDLCRSHGQVRALPGAYDFNEHGRKWRILAQRANRSMQYTSERWIDPEDVTETIPATRMHEGILKFFEDNLEEE